MMKAIDEEVLDQEQDDQEQDDELSAVAMQIILHAGNAKTAADEAFRLAKEEKFKEAYQKIEEAESNGILNAHQAQFEIIQSEARGIPHKPSFLFIHAQDHLMTIKSEVSTTKKMIELYELIVNKRND